LRHKKKIVTVFKCECLFFKTKTIIYRNPVSNARVEAIWDIMSVFTSIVAGTFQIIFHVKMHANDVFSFFLNYFWYQHIKTIQNIQTILNFSKKKLKFFRNAAAAAFPNVPIWMLRRKRGIQSQKLNCFKQTTTIMLANLERIIQLMGGANKNHEEYINFPKYLPWGRPKPKPIHKFD